MSHTNYIAKQPDKNGIVNYTQEENAVWHELITRQQKIIQGRACREYIHGLELLNLPQDRVPQCHEVTEVLHKTTGWSLAPVPALIPFEKFFQLLANRQFPAATFIRTPEEIDYLKEPDSSDLTFPLMNTEKYKYVSRFSCFGWLSSKSNQDFFINLVVQDIEKNKPAYIFVDRRGCQTNNHLGYFGNRQIDYLALFSSNPQFVIDWASYHYLKTIEGQPLFRFDVYKRDQI